MTRLKMFAFLPRRPGIEAQDFHDHWRHPHGTWGKRISTVQRYVQSHRVESSALPGTQRTYDGVVEVWIDGVADASLLPEHINYRKYLVPDEPNFIDMDKIRFAFTEEDILQSGPDPEEIEGSADFLWKENDVSLSFKIIQIFSGDASWRGAADLSLGQAIGALRHVCCRSTRALALAEDTPAWGVRELWWPTLSDFRRGIDRDPAAFHDLILARGGVPLLCQAERYL